MKFYAPRANFVHFAATFRSACLKSARHKSAPFAHRNNKKRNNAAKGVFRAGGTYEEFFIGYERGTDGGARHTIVQEQEKVFERKGADNKSLAITRATANICE